MKRVVERNIKAFNQDIKDKGQYAYTLFKSFSAIVATKKQSEEIHNLLIKQTKKNYTILDVGSGDGTFTFEILNTIKPKKIVGFDNARLAVKIASKKIAAGDKKKIEFKYCNIYDVNKIFPKNSFDIVVIRGVLHHLYNPEIAIKALSVVSKKIIVLEPNGYNPILKIIEKASPYHIKHEEKSYWPPKINQWFIHNGYVVKKQIFCGVVPYFCPAFLAKVLKKIEPFIERLPLKIFLCGTNVIYYEKR